ncbi:MAG: hypothetical protein ACJ72O_12905, partial [Marmoricola sp.]
MSVLVAFAIATLLAFGGNAAYADGGAAGGAAGASSAAGSAGAGSLSGGSFGGTKTSTSTTKTSSTPKSAGTTKTAGTTKAAPTKKSAAATSGKTMAALIADPIVSALTVACIPGSGTVVGGFEIDGDTCAETDQDWDTTGLHTDDGFGDDTGFTNGASENDPPTSWGIGHAANAKSDIGEFWAFSKAINSTVYGFFGLTNDSVKGGTSQYDLEYNQLAAVPGSGGHPVPHRSPMDLLFRFSSTGSAALTFSDAKRYTLQSSAAWDAAKCFATDAAGGWCTIPIPPNAFASALNDDGTFIEGAIDIGLFVDNVGDCTGNFGVTSVRSVTGNSFATSALKDYVDPLPVNTPSTCGTIVINKN